MAILKFRQKPARIEQIAEEIERSKQKTPGFEELFDLYFDCFKVQLSYLPRIKVKVKKPSPKQIEGDLGEGRPLLDTKALPVDADLFNGVIAELGNVIRAKIARHNPSNKDYFVALLSHPDLERDEEGVSPFLRNLLSFNTNYFTELAKSLSLDNEIVLFTAFQAISPFLEKASFSLRDRFDYEGWQRGFCPVCGRKPSMAEIRKEDGLKILQCSFCRSWWTYPDAKCTVCGNEDGETLEFLHSQGDDARRADLCTKCKKYIKTIDCRKLDREVNLEIEDLVTIYLDVAAKERGYESAGRVIYTFTVE